MYSKSNLIACDLLIKLETGDQKIDYTTDPNGKVNVPKLLGKEDECWEKKKPKESWANPVFVITDWSYNSSVINLNKIGWIHELMDQAFEIYAWTGELAKIESHYDLEKSLKNIKPIHPSELEPILAKNDIEKDQVKIIDYLKRRQIEAFLNDGEIIEPTLNFYDIENGFSPIEIESILNSLSPYVYFDISVQLCSINDFNLLLKFAELPQSRGLNCILSSSEQNKDLNDFAKIFSKYIKNLTTYSTSENALLLESFLNQQDLKNLKEIDIDNNNCGGLKSLDFTPLSDQLKSIILNCISYSQCKLGSFHSLQELKLQTFNGRMLLAIGSLAPNIETLHLDRHPYDTFEFINEIELPKLKKLHLRHLTPQDVTEILKLPYHLEELTLDNVHNPKTIEFENITQLKKLCIHDTWMPVDCFITLLKNNIYLEKIILIGVTFISKEGCFDDEIDLRELLGKSSQLMLSLRSLEIRQEKDIDLHAFTSTLIREVNSIEDLTFAQQKNYAWVNKGVSYKKNHQIHLYGNDVEASLLSLFLNHSDSLNYIHIRSQSISADLVRSCLLEHKDKLSQIKVLNLPNFSQENYLALFPTLKRINFIDFSFMHGSLQINGELDFQTFLKFEQHNNSDLTQLILKSNDEVYNEELLLEHANDFALKHLSISDPFESYISPKAISKLINHSPHLESLSLIQAEPDSIDTLSKSLEVLQLEGLTTAKICNFLKHKPVLKRLELHIFGEENESLFKLLEQCIAASTALNHLVIKGAISANQSQRIVDFMIKNHREMHTLILAEHFVFEKNEKLCVTIPVKEEYLLSLLTGSHNFTTLMINQPFPIQKLLEGGIWGRLDFLSLVSCMDSRPSTESLSEAFDHLLSQCPSISQTISLNISVNFYRQNSFFIVSKMKNDKIKLHTTERLSNVQLANYISDLNLERFEIQGINGLLEDKDPTKICSLKLDLKDSSSLLENLDYFIKKTQFDDFSLCSPSLKITNSDLELHGDKLTDEQIDKVYKLAKKLTIKTVTIHSKLSLAVIAALDKEPIQTINLVNVNQQEELISQLVKSGRTITAKNSTLQVLYQICHTWKELSLSGVQFPPSLFNLILQKEENVFYTKLSLEDFSFAAAIKFSNTASYNFCMLILKNANIEVGFILRWLLFRPENSSQIADINDCPTITADQLAELKQKFPKFDCRFQEQKSTPTPSQNLLTQNSFEQDESLNLIDARTGEQQAKTNFGEGSGASFIREKKCNKIYPNYLRLQVQNDGVNVVKKLKNIAYRKDIIKLYEEVYEDNPDYFYLS